MKCCMAMNYFDKIRKELPVVTVLVVIFYFFSYFFQVGYSVFWGFPSEYIEINLDVMLSTSAAFLMVLLVASYLIEALVRGSKLSFLAAVAYCCLFSLFLIFLICGMKSTLDLFKGVVYFEHFFIFAFVACSFYAASGIRKFLTQSFTHSQIASTVLTVISLCGWALLSGMLYSLMPWRGYISNDGMILVAKYSDSSIFGQCFGKTKSYKVIPANEDVKLTKISATDMKVYKRCFIDNF